MERDLEQIKKRFSELAERAYGSNMFTFTPFLGLQEQSVFHGMLRSLQPVGVTLFGGVEGCERKMVRFGDAEALGYEEPFPILAVRIAPRSAKFAEDLTHRDFLGALMSLGIERDTLGDIILREKEAYVFAAAHIAPFLEENLQEVRRTSVRAEIAASVPEGELFRLQGKTVQVTSVRADAVAAHVWNLSRGESQNCFRAGRAFINGALTESPAASLKEGDILSIRGLGRLVYRGEGGMTKKGKHNVHVDVYV